MANHKYAAPIAGLLLCVFVGATAKGPVAETAVFPPDAANAKTDRVVYSLQFSANGTHLLVVGGVPKPSSNPNTSIPAGAIWDLGDKKLVSFWSNASPLGPSNGAQEAAGNQIIGGWSVSGSSICDNTGKVIKPGPFDGLFRVYCTAQASSADGALLALAWDQPIGKSSGAKTQYRIGSIGVWDVMARKWKWRLPGAEQEAEIILEQSPCFHDQRAADRAHVGNLAFSPDGSRLAAVVGTQLHILALESGKDAPALSLTTELHRQYQAQLKKLGSTFAWVEDGTRTPHQFQWLANGMLLKQKDTAFVFLDAATGKLKDSFDLQELPKAAPDDPPARAPKRRPAKRPPPKAAPQTQPVATQPAETKEDEAQPFKTCHGTSLSAQAKMLAVLYSQQSDEFAVAIWDVAARQRRGLLKLPADPFGKAGIPDGAVMVGPNVFVPPPRKPGQPVNTRRGSFPIALSPDGQHLAVPDRYGVVHVYDVAQLEANTPEKTGNH